MLGVKYERSNTAKIFVSNISEPNINIILDTHHHSAAQLGLDPDVIRSLPIFVHSQGTNPDPVKSFTSHRLKVFEEEADWEAIKKCLGCDQVNFLRLIRKWGKTKRVEGLIHDYRNEAFIPQSDAFFFYGGSEGLYASKLINSSGSDSDSSSSHLHGKRWV